MARSLIERVNPRYVLNICDEPKQLLEPITGYAYKPLLSLEDACQPLLDIVARLPAHIWVAKQNSKHPDDGLTQDESAAIRLYTMEWDTASNEPSESLYVHLNQTLKLVDRKKLRPWFRYLKLFLTALAKLPATPHQTVWRGVRRDCSDDYPPGAEITWWAFSSCTTSLSVLESDLYLGNVGTRTLFSIETINGRAIRSHSHFTTEDEILLLPGTYFEVKSRLNPAPDLFIVHLQQKIPPHVLLEPPFKGAELLPPSETDRSIRTSINSIKSDNYKDIPRPWYKKKTIALGIGALLVVIIVGIILGAVLGTRRTTQTLSTAIFTNMSIFYNGSVPDPVSVADAFYSFDGNLFDLYSRRDGEVIGGSIGYMQGYVTSGKAIVLSQSIATQINIKPGFNLNVNSNFTIQGFFMLNKTQMNATLIQLTPLISMNLNNGLLSASLGSDIIVTINSVISTQLWHHFSLVYDGIQQTAAIYIDGIGNATRSSILEVSSNNLNSTIVVGAGFEGCIDQLSISLEAKPQEEVLWDATVAGYYRLDTSWLLDSGPNGVNATTLYVIPIKGWKFYALNFGTPGAYYQVNGFTVLGTPNHAFSVILWVRAEIQNGVFLTVANPYTCLLVLGLQNDTNRLVAFLPNATASGTGVNIMGPLMPSNAWVHVAITWSVQNRANLYTSSYLQAIGFDASTLNNVGSGNSSSPMTVTLGKYTGAANCQGIQGIDTSQQFMGSLDELYVFGRELQQNELVDIIQPLPV